MTDSTAPLPSAQTPPVPSAQTPPAKRPLTVLWLTLAGVAVAVLAFGSGIATATGVILFHAAKTHTMHQGPFDRNPGDRGPGDGNGRHFEFPQRGDGTDGNGGTQQGGTGDRS
jgi:hypothetical protein